jgi:hypothetical protein
MIFVLFLQIIYSEGLKILEVMYASAPRCPGVSATASLVRLGYNIEMFKYLNIMDANYELGHCTVTSFHLHNHNFRGFLLHLHISRRLA